MAKILVMSVSNYWLLIIRPIFQIFHIYFSQKYVELLLWSKITSILIQNWHNVFVLVGSNAYMIWISLSLWWYFKACIFSGFRNIEMVLQQKLQVNSHITSKTLCPFVYSTLVACHSIVMFSFIHCCSSIMTALLL